MKNFALSLALVLAGCSGFETVQYQPPDVIYQDRTHTLDPGADPLKIYEERDYWENMNE